MNLPGDDTGELSRFVDVDRRAYESGAIACDDHVDGVSNGSGNQDVVLKIRAAPFDSIAKDVTANISSASRQTRTASRSASASSARFLLTR